MGRKARSMKGFTLLELTVGAAVTSIILLGVAASFIGAQRVYASNAEAGSAISGGRQSMSYVENMLKYAAYGIEPRFAFDFRPVLGAFPRKDNAQLQAPGIPFRESPAILTDDLAFRYRDPSFSKKAKLWGGWPNFTVDISPATWGADFPAGTKLLFGCTSNVPTPWFALQLTGAVTAAGMMASATALQGGLNNEPNWPVWDPTTCPWAALTGTDNYILLMNEVRLRIKQYNENGTMRPYLVAIRDLAVDPGVISGTLNNTFLEDPIVANVEKFQVSYVMHRPSTPTRIQEVCGPTATAPPWDVDNPTPGQGDWILGNDSADPVRDAVTGSMIFNQTASYASLWAVGTTPAVPLLNPYYKDRACAWTRFTPVPANIRGVSISIQVRGATVNRKQLNRSFSQLLENERTLRVPTGALGGGFLDKTPACVTGSGSSMAPCGRDGYYRTVYNTTVEVPNMNSYFFFNPEISSPPKTNENVAGG